jgi:hypothetical protein
MKFYQKVLHKKAQNVMPTVGAFPKEPTLGKRR